MEPHETKLPNWANACRLIVLVELSSAASEQVFSKKRIIHQGLLLNAFVLLTVDPCCA